MKGDDELNRVIGNGHSVLVWHRFLLTILNMEKVQIPQKSKKTEPLQIALMLDKMERERFLWFELLCINKQMKEPSK